ncbi:uncharacterized protein I206_104126 [Kwoniella pini CBS 10737]|uniref:Uncharacterized protein n=1 Tax=Kwoniella pini CBS 10737 TaxID=1296096 RepID=A0A1B9I2K4_9TREE|nr:uncharacterized protein I206_04298 [Kwoniella pini CBS 10737]OCF49772.1 hypothetical protein I206_04298 [Kwoniella pini CBS 10737]
MVFKLEPIEIIAISLASIAVLLIISYIIYKLTLLYQKNLSKSTIITPINESREVGYNNNNNREYNYNYNNPYMNYINSPSLITSSKSRRDTPTPITTSTTIIQNSPSTCQKSLITPLSNPNSNSNGSIKYQHKLKKSGLTISSPWQKDKDKNKELNLDKIDKINNSNNNDDDNSDELVVVTYEDGLKKLGIKSIKEQQINFQNQSQNQIPFNRNGNKIGDPTSNYNTSYSIRPDLLERESSRKTYYNVIGRGNGSGGKRGYTTRNIGKTNSNLLPSYYVTTNPGNE